MTAVHHLVVGDPRHGVTRLGRSLLARGAAVTAAPSLAHVVHASDAAADAILPAPADAPYLHAHVNDDLLGDDALDVVERIGARRRLALTLHDVPQPEEGAARYARRRRLYRALAERADLVLVLSEHERASLRACGYAGDLHVVVHPIDARPATARPTLARTVGMLGWVHPGKGYREAIDATAQALPGGTLLALGAVAPGHEDFARELLEHATACGLGWSVSGFLPTATLLARAADVAVPLCTHRHVSASGSLGTWMAAGRVPIVADHAYTREVARRCPGSVTVTTTLATAIATAAVHPAGTLITGDLQIGPTTAAAAARQAEVLARWAAR